ncbi:hypothetical protein R1sor_019817 [Riccia sorocarpa]|uniref:Uncharacterized protein n=1 Tax=Riccia sorocarpa TaxID=122646 RepID=A0ABD3IHE3_9MARC
MGWVHRIYSRSETLGQEAIGGSPRSWFVEHGDKPAENVRLSRESKTGSNKRKRDSQVTPPPPSKARNEEAVETLKSDNEESGSSDKDLGDATDSCSDSPPQSQLLNKRGAKLKTLKQMDKSNIDREKQDIRRKAVERCRVSVVLIVIPLEQLVEPTLEQDSSK